LKLATFLADGSERLGLVHSNGRRVFDLAAAAEREGVSNPAFRSMLALIEADEAGAEAAQDTFRKRGSEEDLSFGIDSVRLLSPLPQPPQIRDAMSYPLHIQQSLRRGHAMAALKREGEAASNAILAKPLDELPSVYRTIPIYYITNRMTVRGHDSTVRWPRYSQLIDYELELAAVTRRSRANIPLAEAHNHIFGYTIFNDFSARDVQGLEMEGRLGPSKAKSFDGGNVLGPWIVTADEIQDAQDLKVEVRVNGQVRSRSDTSGMLFSFEQILAHASQDETIHSGECFASGTVGNCSGYELGRYLDDGDVVELEIEKIGVLKNKVERQKA
jgi:2-keto-4-pentenoate hydratase/2-oxohepta-3-ene-1,7-dioic acid hydratase in catechol pathway